MSCLQITVLNPPQSAINALGVEEVLLDLKPNSSLRQSKGAEELNRDGKIDLEGAERINVPGTRVNDLTFGEFATPLTLDQQRKYFDIRAYQHNSEIRLTRLYVIGKVPVSNGHDWELELRRPADHWAELGKLLKINEIDYGTFLLTAETAEANWAVPTYAGDYTPTGDTPTYWAPHDYGDWVDQTEPDPLTFRPLKVVLPEDLRPLISLPYLLKRGACQIGWNVEGVIFDTEFWRSVWVYVLSRTYYLAAPSPKILGLSTGPSAITGLTLAFVFTELDVTDVDMQLDASPGLYIAGTANKIDGAAYYCFKLMGKLANLGGEANDVTFFIGESEPPNVLSGEVLSEEYIVSIGAGETKDIVVEFKTLLKRGQNGAMFATTSDSPVSPELLAGWRFSVTPCNESFVHDETVDVSLAVRDDETWLDWLKIFLRLCNGRTETDWLTHTITIHPNKRTSVYGEIVPGFLREENESIDISHMVISGSTRQSPVRPNLKRYTRYQFAESTDAYIESLNLIEPAYSRKVTNGADLPNEIDEIEVPFLEPTYEGQPTNLFTLKDIESPDKRAPSPYLPRLWDNTEGKRSFDIGPRIFFAYGLVRQINPHPGVDIDVELHAGFYFNGNEAGDKREFFGYATQFPTWELDPEPTLKGTLVFGYDEQDLFVTYLLGATQNNRAGTVLQALLTMNQNDYARFDFRDYFTWVLEGRPLRVPMTDINDFAGCSGLPTPVDFFQEPSETACCDLPCSCRFTTCDFYQDFGNFMRQSTLDALTITSFQVDDVEFITTPIGFGILEIVDLVARPYVTNLYKTLNSLGIPYFTFSESTRIHPEKGMRYFKIKRPACQGFLIEISFEGDVVYRYTEDLQETAWFGAFGDFGYGTEFNGVPLDCFTTVEY